MKSSEAIIAARDSLTEKNWHQGSYFYTNENGICMCAHGALQAQVNERVKAALAPYPMYAGARLPAEAAEAAAADAAVEAAVEAAEAATAAAWAAVAPAAADAAKVSAAGMRQRCRRRGRCGEWSLSKTFSKRPEWVKNNGLDAHYILGMVGLTAMFNDAIETTIEQVKAKFTEAAKIAESLEEAGIQ